MWSGARCATGMRRRQARRRDSVPGLGHDAQSVDASVVIRAAEREAFSPLKVDDSATLGATLGLDYAAFSQSYEEEAGRVLALARRLSLVSDADV